jgi:hypothetical protein
MIAPVSDTVPSRNQRSTQFSQQELAGMERRTNRGLRFSPVCTFGYLWVL